MRRKIGLGAGFWAVIFIVVSVLKVSSLPGPWRSGIEIIVAGLAAYILGRIYFKKAQKGISEAIILFVVWFVVSGILDLLITIQFVKGSGTYFEGLGTFYTMETLWVSFLAALLGLLAATKTGGGFTPLQTPPSPPSQV